MAQTPKRPLHQARLCQPRIEIVAEHVLVEQLGQVEPPGLDHLAHVVERPDGKRLFVGYEAERRGERVATEIVLMSAREGFDQDLIWTGHNRNIGLEAKPVRDLVREP